MTRARARTAVGKIVLGCYGPAVQAAEKAALISPSFALAHPGVGIAKLYVGDASGAVEPLKRGLNMKRVGPWRQPFEVESKHQGSLLPCAP